MGSRLPAERTGAVRSFYPWIVLISLTLLQGSADAGSPLAGNAIGNPPRFDPREVRLELRRDLVLRSTEDLVTQNVVYPDRPDPLSVSGRDDRVDAAGRVPPGLAFLMSAVLPGSGQIAEGRNRAFLYLGVEALAWISHFAWRDAGEKKEGEYEAYARRHWDIDQWRTLASGDIDTCLDALPAGVDPVEAEQTLLDFLESGNYQHYYEDIGKLEAYRAGWDDFACSSPEEITPNRREYRSMRSDSNTYLEKARFATTIAFLNRIVSAVDAYRTARGARLSVSSTTTLELGLAGSFHRPRATLRIRRQW